MNSVNSINFLTIAVADRPMTNDQNVPKLYALSSKLLGWLELVVLISLVLVYSLVTLQRNFVWKNDISLWSDCIKKSPYKARPHNNLSAAYDERELPEQAIAEAFKAIRLNPKSANPFISLGNAYFKKGLFDMAIMSYKSALHIKSTYPEAYHGIGNTYTKKGELEKAMEAYKKVIALRPDDIIARLNLSALYGSVGLTEQAIRELMDALVIKPDSSDIHYNLGVAYEELAKSYELRAKNKEPRATSYEQKDLINKAINEYKKTLMLNPDDVEAKEKLMKLSAKGREQ